MLKILDALIFSILHYQSYGIKEIKKALDFIGCEIIENQKIVEDNIDNIYFHKTTKVIYKAYTAASTVTTVWTWVSLGSQYFNGLIKSLPP